MTISYESLATRAIGLYEKKGKRVIIGLTGIPGSGKSTIANAISECINEKGVECVVVGIDGFHYPRSHLRKMPDPELAFKRRGASFTFDAANAVKFIESLADARAPIFGPTFDHGLKDPVDNGLCIPESVKIIIVEGLYLLLDLKPWNTIKSHLDESWFIDIDFETCRERVARRHVASGIESNMEDAYIRVDSNDTLNGEFVIEHSMAPDLVIKF